MKSKVLEICGGTKHAPRHDYSVGRHLVGICPLCDKVVRLHADHTLRTHGRYLRLDANSTYGAELGSAMNQDDLDTFISETRALLDASRAARGV